MLHGKKILLGITGSIAAYKSLLIVRELVKAGAEVKVVVTGSALDFVTTLSISTLSNNEVFHSLQDGSTWHNHVELGLWADLYIVAPCTANTIAKMAHGICDNMVLASYLSARCPVIIAPAMDLDMWAHPSTQRNINQLKSDGVQVVQVGHGLLASGLVGDGRMAEPEDIVSEILPILYSRPKSLNGKKIIITAGPTYESLDPVRYIGNWSSGKMGIAIAEACYLSGADVHLVLGPTALRPQWDGIHVHSIKSAADMYDKAIGLWSQCDVGILAAAVADYTPTTIADQKIKKQSGDWSLPLMRTKDIAAELGKQKREDQFLVGFALETQNEEVNAKAKLEKKNFDFIVLNSLNDTGAGFGHDTNKVKFLTANGEIKNFALQTKNKVAFEIVNELDKILK
ncbi:bifunctional phosphopantothenoylcysteine decarboxylase/phosphopantothenate--cysteine ligase CoaBC [Membranihabitans marinus]|uniref:bifunctional phosphopantothenoylcysteine decarboxylase/phosphopantothenate--cysteine ligase CoaBC n=1 Tax=Membranihabitans marinus TaxID=1227546 RepID=UPI00374C9E40